MTRSQVVWLLLASMAGRLAGQPTPPAGVAYTAGFQPGGQQLFLLDLSGTPVGEIPTTIKLLGGNLEVVLQGGTRMLKASSASEFLITLPQVLPQDFTLEFELIPKTCCPPPDLSIEGTPTINQGVGSAHLLWQADGYLAVVGGAQDNYEQPMPEELKATLPGVLTQVGVSVSGPTVKLYTNGRRLFTLDRVFARGRVLRVALGGADDVNAVYLAALRIATGAPVSLAGSAAAGGAGAAGGGNTQSTSQGVTGVATPVVSNVAVTPGTAGPVVTWGVLSGVTSYTVKRWMLNDPACCSGTSPVLSGPPWQDGPLPVAGTYVFEVTATIPGGVATGQAQFVQFGTGGRIATATPAPAPAPAPAPVTMLPATQRGTITPMPPPPPASVTLSGAPTAPAAPVTGGTAGSGASGTIRLLSPTGPAPTGLTISGTPTTASLRWNAVTGAVGYQVLRAVVGGTGFVALTPSPITATALAGDVLPDRTRSYTYQVQALQADGTYGMAQANFTPPTPVDPANFKSSSPGDGVVQLAWSPVNGVRAYLLSGPGIPAGTEVNPAVTYLPAPFGMWGQSFTVSAAPPGVNEYRIASVYDPGGVLTPASSWPSTTVPLSSISMLTLPNGSGSLAEYNRHACNAGKWLSTQQLWINTWCDLPTAQSTAWVSAFPLLSLFGIQEYQPRQGSNFFTGEIYDLFPPATEWTLFTTWAWARGNQLIPQPDFTDVADLGFGRRIGCVARGTGASASTLCWAWSFPHSALSVIIQAPQETSFFVFKEFVDDKENGCPWPNRWREPSWVDQKCGKLVGVAATTLDSEGDRFIPHACLACHGGQFDPATGKVTGASLLPLDPRGFSFNANGRGALEETLRQINLTIFNAPVSTGVRDYITAMYRARQTVIGATVDDAFVPAGWTAQPGLYQDIYRPYCASCHSTQSGPLGFRSWGDLLREKARVKRAVCGYTMPHSELPFRKFWTEGGVVSRPGVLLLALGYSSCAQP